MDMRFSNNIVFVKTKLRLDLTTRFIDPPPKLSEPFKCNRGWGAASPPPYPKTPLPQIN
jgi:hypothetical protein